MVRIENPLPGKRSEISAAAASEMISAGGAVAVASIDGALILIRLTGRVQGTRRLTERGYDGVSRSFFGEARALPLLMPEKMIRQERSPRDWSYSESVRRRRTADHTKEQVDLLRHPRKAPSPDVLGVCAGAR